MNLQCINVQLFTKRNDTAAMAVLVRWPLADNSNRILWVSLEWAFVRRSHCDQLFFIYLLWLPCGEWDKNWPVSIDRQTLWSCAYTISPGRLSLNSIINIELWLLIHITTHTQHIHTNIDIGIGIKKTVSNVQHFCFLSFVYVLSAQQQSNEIIISIDSHSVSGILFLFSRRRCLYLILHESKLIIEHYSFDGTLNTTLSQRLLFQPRQVLGSHSERRNLRVFHVKFHLLCAVLHVILLVLRVCACWLLKYVALLTIGLLLSFAISIRVRNKTNTHDA